MSLLVFYVLLALGVSFMCSVMEAVLLSVTPSYVMMLEREGRPAGRRLRALKDDIDRPLAAILSRDPDETDELAAEGFDLRNLHRFRSASTEPSVVLAQGAPASACARRSRQALLPEAIITRGLD